MKRITIILLMAMIINSCASIKTISLSYYSKQITFFENTADYYTGDMIKKCKLCDTVKLNGYNCISWIHFFENGQIKQFETATDLNMNDFTIPSNSVVFFNEHAPNKIKNIWFSKDITIYGVNCRGGSKISTEFYDNDSLKTCFLSKDQKIQGFPCKSSLLEPVYFYPNGKVKILTLNTDFKIAEIEYKTGESLEVSENGLVSKYKR